MARLRGFRFVAQAPANGRLPLPVGADLKEKFNVVSTSHAVRLVFRKTRSRADIALAIELVTHI